MTQEEIKGKVMPIVEKYVGSENTSIDPSDNLYEEHGADSLDIMLITMDVEQAFSISITDDMVHGFRTTQDIIDEVQRHILD